jgi:hypothetical protein
MVARSRSRWVSMVAWHGSLPDLGGSVWRCNMPAHRFGKVRANPTVLEDEANLARSVYSVIRWQASTVGSVGSHKALTRLAAYSIAKFIFRDRQVPRLWVSWLTQAPYYRQ